jgi:translocation and assembly module TamB
MSRLRHLKAFRLWLPVLAGLLGAFLVLVHAGVLDRAARRVIIGELERATGGKVELARVKVHYLPLGVELFQLTLHGREQPGEPPFLRIRYLQAQVALRWLLRGPLRLDSLQVEEPAVFVRVDASGESNLPPIPHRQPARPWHEQLFRVIIARLRIEHGTIVYNNRRIPLTADGGLFRMTLDYVAPQAGPDFYTAELSWNQMQVVALRYVPFRSSWLARLTLGRRGGSLDWFEWRLPHSTVLLRADWPVWGQHTVQLSYRMRVDLQDVRTILRKPRSPLGVLESAGRLQYTGATWQLEGYYTAQNIQMNYRWYHAREMSSRGTLRANPAGLLIPDFEAWALGGHFVGQIRMDPHGWRFTSTTRAEGVGLPALFAAVQNPDLPLQTLHWDGSASLEAVTTWQADFKHMASRGTMTWQPAVRPAPGRVPASAVIRYDYAMDRDAVTLGPSEITTPATQLAMEGTIGGRRSLLSVDLTVADLREWSDFIDYLRGAGPEAPVITGRAHWKGRVLGRITAPTFVGQVHLWNASYGRLFWDEIRGGVEYSPVELRLHSLQVRRGSSNATVELRLQLSDWLFRSTHSWRLQARLAATRLADLQELAGTHYPAQGLLSGEFVGGGTRAQPVLTGRFTLTRFWLAGVYFPMAAGWVRVERGRVELEGIEANLREGRLAGRLVYAWPSGQSGFDLRGSDIALSEVPGAARIRPPLAGWLDFHLSGSGPLGAPAGEGTVRVRRLRMGNERVGDLSVAVTSDGQRAQARLTSQLERGSLKGTLTITLARGWPVLAELNAAALDADPLIEAGLHLKALTGHSRLDGQVRLTGLLAHPETLEVEARLQRASVTIQNVELESTGPVVLRYRAREVMVEQASFRGPDSNFQLQGRVQFRPPQVLHLTLRGALNLRMVEAFVARLQARGIARVSATLEGTLAAPRLAGQARLENASLHYGDLPVGLSQVNGDLLFTNEQVTFSGLQAVAGGGQLVLSGAASYPAAGRPLHYGVAIEARQVRVRYPEGMSWLLNASARLDGDLSGALLSGRITVQRLFLVNGLDLAAFMMAARAQGTTVPATTPFLSNLNLDLQVDSGPGARLEWSGARLEADASLRVRGSWDRPAVLGHVHLLGGEMDVRGNRFRLTRGDLNFADPLRLDPVLNVEATTTVQQYEVTVDLTGRASAMRLSYRSDPPLPETDVIALLALGRTGEASELRTAAPTQPGQFGASALLSEAISSEVGGRIAQLFGISRLQIDPFVGGIGTESNAAARLTIEQRITPNLTVTYATNATSSAEQVIQIEYTVSRNVSIVALRDINGTFGIDVKFRKRFP